METDSDDYSETDQSDARSLGPPSPPSPPPPVCQTRSRSLRGWSQSQRRRCKQQQDHVTAVRGRSQRKRRRVEEQKKEGVTVRRTQNDGKRHWDKKHFCVFCKRPQVKIARHLLRKHADQQEVAAAGILPAGSKKRHLLLERLRCRGNYLHNIEVIRQGSGEIVPSRQPSEDVDARNYLPCPLCLGFFLRADLWKHQATCRKKLLLHPSKVPHERSHHEATDRTIEATPPEDTPSPPAVSGAEESLSDGGNKPCRKRRVQAAASRLLPICSSASESCSQILHRMNLDNISYEVKSDWLICKYGNRLMGSEDGDQKSYDYVSQKLRELGRLLLAAKSLDPSVHTLQDLLVPGRLSLTLGAARKAAGNRWSRPPLAVKTMLKVVCEIAIAERLKDGDWESAARTTDFYHVLEREWENLGLQNPAPEKVDPEADVQTGDGDTDGIQSSTDIPAKFKLQLPALAPLVQKKARRRPWSLAEKEAVWRQLGAHVLFHSVPGKELCQRCLDLEPVLRGRHWKDVKNQVHNQIQTQKKQQFHAQMDVEQNQSDSPKKKPSPYQVQMVVYDKEPELNQDQQQYHNPVEQQDLENSHILKRQRYQDQIEHQNPNRHQNQKKSHELDQNHVLMPKKPLFNSRLDLQNLSQTEQDQKKHLYNVEQSLQNLNQNSPILTLGPFGSDSSQSALGLSLLERDASTAGFPLLHRTSVPGVEQLLSRTDWPADTLTQNYPIKGPVGRNLLQDGALGGPGHVHF